MRTSELAAKLQQWAREFARLSTRQSETCPRCNGEAYVIRRRKWWELWKLSPFDECPTCNTRGHIERDGDFHVPDNFWQFLAARITELGVVQSDPDVVTAKTPLGYRKVRVTRTQAGMLVCDFADGAGGFVLVRPQDVADEDRGKLTQILGKL